MNILSRLIEHVNVHKWHTNNTELSIRCPACGDSKDLTHTHLYISNEYPFKFYCMKCNFHGVINENFLTLLKYPKIYELIIELKHCKFHNKKETVVYSNNYNSDVIYNINNNALSYLINRLGNHLYDPMLCNIISTQHIKNFEHCIKTNYISFLSYDKSYVISRNMLNDSKYHKHNIHQLKPNGSKVCVLKTELDYNSPTIDVVVTEGIFDILSVYYNINHFKNNAIYISLGGKTFGKIFDIIKSVGIANVNLHIFSDDDVELIYYKKFFYYEKIYNTITVYYNKKSKDFGVVKDNIEIEMYKL